MRETRNRNPRMGGGLHANRRFVTPPRGSSSPSFRGLVGDAQVRGGVPGARPRVHLDRDARLARRRSVRPIACPHALPARRSQFLLRALRTTLNSSLPCVAQRELTMLVIGLLVVDAKVFSRMPTFEKKKNAAKQKAGLASGQARRGVTNSHCLPADAPRDARCASMANA